MSVQLLSVFVLVLSAAISVAPKDPLSQCKLLSNPNIAPLIYFSQSELAVIAHYSRVDYNAFKQGQRMPLYITPLCYVKGYFTSGIELEVWSGYQKCPIVPLSTLVEYPSLFFLRKDRESNRWILLNGGEYEHRVDTSGLLFGVGPGGQDFPQVCGVKRRRIPMDVGKCQNMNCRAYCNYRLAPPDNCKNKEALMQRYIKSEDIPKEVPPYNDAKDSRNSAGGNKVGQGTTMKGKDTTKANGAESVTYEPNTADNEDRTVQATGGNSAVAVAQTTSLLMLAVLFALFRSR